MARRSSAFAKLIDSLPDPDERGRLSNIDKQAVDNVTAQINEGGRRRLISLVDMLVEPGAGDDVKARYALHCLAVHVCKLDNDRTRRAFATTLASQLGGDRPKAVQKYVIEQLQVAGGKEVAATLGRMLLDEQLCEPAAQALTAIGDAEQFRNALPKASGKARLTIIQNLGVLGDAASAGQLKTALGDEDREIRLVAGWALANMGDSGSVDLLLRAAEAEETYERLKATNACLLLAEKLLAAGRKEPAVKIYERLRDTRNGSDEAYVRIAANAGLATVGWEVLFDGSDLDDNWQKSRWVVKDRVLTNTRKAGMIWSKERFGDFVLDLEFKTEGNSGIFFRTDNTKNPVQTGIEIQVNKRVANPTTHSCGAVYDALAPSKEMTKDGQWNHITITARDNEIDIVLNGEQIIDMDLNEWTEAGWNPGPPRKKNKFKTALKDFKREGHIGFQDHGANVWYRNVRIKRL